MLHINTTPEQRRQALRDGLASGKLLRFAGTFIPIVAKIAEDIGFEGAYIGGAAAASEQAVADIEMVTLTEFCQRGYHVARATNLPTMIDVDTGFGPPHMAFKTVREVEAMGISSLHIEDQASPKRCGHLDNKKVVSVHDMQTKIRAMADGRLDKNFVIVARSDARAVEGIDRAIDRLKAYGDAGADVLFPEGFHTYQEFEKVRKAVDLPILANITEFGQTDLLSTQQMTDIGINIALYPMTAFRFALKAIEDNLREMFETGSQAHMLDRMMTRKRLYEVIDYAGYNRFDPDTMNFDVPEGDKKTSGQAAE